jgi:hypothetical protein
MATQRHTSSRQHTGDPQAPTRYGIPELRNPRYLAIFRAGQEARVKADQFGVAAPDAVPLYSHNATYQALFTKGWESLSEVDLMRLRARRAERDKRGATSCCH